MGRSDAVRRGIGSFESLTPNLAPGNRRGTEGHDHITASVGASRTVRVGSRRRATSAASPVADTGGSLDPRLVRAAEVQA